MAVVVEWFDAEFTWVDSEQRWTGTDGALVDVLNSRLDPDGPSGADPHPGMTAAQDVRDNLGAVIVEEEETEELVEGVDY